MLGFFRPKPFLPEEDCKKVEEATIEAEKLTSGKIRVHIESHCEGDPMKAAKEVFAGIGMDRTELKNGVLIYLAMKDKEFTIIGDEGINKKVPENFWEDVKNEMEKLFRVGKITEGIIAGVKKKRRKTSGIFPAGRR